LFTSLKQVNCGARSKKASLAHEVVLIARGFLMAKLTVCAAFLLAVVGGQYAADAWAADIAPTKAPASLADATAAPQPCADPSDFITTNCQLTWHGITLSAPWTWGLAGKATARLLTQYPLSPPHT